MLCLFHLRTFIAKHCREKILFPFPSRKEKEQHQSRLPKDSWQAYVLCSHCEQLFLYKAVDVQLARPLHTEDRAIHTDFRTHDDYFYRVEHKCGWQNCGLPQIVFVYSTSYLSERAAAAKVMNAHPTAWCAKGNALNPTSQLVSVREVFSLE